ncbi:MAG: response regulator [Proteobacteria bacterium]|nr:response regulator [Pseudomonadota bacterium]
MNLENILIVDADPATRQMIIQIIASRCHTFKTAENGMEALDLIKKIDFDIVIADINVPIINGLDLMSEVKKIKPETVFMILTGYSRDYSYERVIGAGAKDFIKKPFTIEELKNKIVRIIDERKIKEENKRLLIQQADLNVQLKALLSVASDLASELEFDRKNNFRTRSVLCLPIKNHGGENVGVLQVINKKDKTRFDARDEIFCKGLAS